MKPSNKTAYSQAKEVEKILLSYKYHEACLLHGFKYNSSFEKLREKIAIDLYEKKSQEFIDELEEFAFNIKTPDVKDKGQTEGDVKLHLSKILYQLTRLLNDHYRFWDIEMIEIIRNQVISYKYLYNALHKQGILS